MIKIYLPYHEASVIVIEKSLLDFEYKSRMTKAGIDRFMPNPINRKPCAMVANDCNNSRNSYIHNLLFKFVYKITLLHLLVPAST